MVGRTRLAARQLLSQLQDAERAAGRRAARRRWGPRPLDLDLLLYGSEPMRMPGLVVPHPRMRDRGFVLIPLAAIAPEWIVAAHGEERPATVQELAALVDRSGVRVTNLSLEG